MIVWLAKNKEWVFSGAGVFVVSVIVALLFRRSDNGKQNQSSGANSVNIQAGKDIHIGQKNDRR